MLPDWVKPYHDKVTEGWINHMYPINKGNMKRVDNQRELSRGLKIRSKGMIHVSVYEPRQVKPIGPHNIATKIKNALPAPEQKAPSTATVIRNTAKRKRHGPEPDEPAPPPSAEFLLTWRTEVYPNTKQKKIYLTWAAGSRFITMRSLPSFESLISTGMRVRHSPTLRRCTTTSPPMSRAWSKPTRG